MKTNPEKVKAWKARSKGLKAKTGFKRPATGHRKPQVKRKKVKRTKLPSIKTMRTKCDNLLTPIIKKMYPNCLLTGAPTEVAHHHVHKSKSAALRYYIPNLIPLTGSAHVALHHNESYWASKIVQIRGIEWFEDLEREKRREMKIDVHYYIAEHKRLPDILASL